MWSPPSATPWVAMTSKSSPRGAQHAEVERTAPEIDRQHAATRHFGVRNEVAHGRGHRLRIEHVFLYSGVTVGLAEARERQLAAVRVAAFELHWMTDPRARRGTDSRFDLPSHVQQNRCDQGDQAERMVEYHEAPHVRIAEQPFDAAEQPPLQSAVSHRLAIDLPRQRLDRTTPLRIGIAHHQRRFADDLGHQLDGAPGVVSDVAFDRAWPTSVCSSESI